MTRMVFLFKALKWFQLFNLIINFWDLMRSLGSIWFPKNIKEKKVKENDFFMFGCPTKNIKK